ETVDSAEWKPPAPREAAIEAFVAAPARKRSMPVFAGTAASMAAAMLGLAGLVNMNHHPATQRLAPPATTEDPGTIPAPIAALSHPPAAIGPDFHPEAAIALVPAAEPRPLPAGTSLLVEIAANGRT